ncbi:MAG TPA: metalloregulator ArsR/SmtB family transcription factor [Solirubrobacterales bacterium]
MTKTEERSARSELFEHLAVVGKALGNGKRLELLELLAQGPRGVVELAEEAGLGVTTTSAHLQTLRRAGLVSTEREGTTIRYSLADDHVASLYGTLLDVAPTRSPAVREAVRAYLGDEDVAMTKRAELPRLLAAGEGVVLDVRPAREYRSGHIPGALSIPAEKLAQRLGEVPDDLHVVVCGRGPYCLSAYRAVHLLSARDRDVTLLAGGLVGWRQSDGPLVSDAG